MNIATRGSNDAFDRLFLIACAFLVIGGIVMLASASMPISMKHFGSPYGYVNKQLFSIGLGLAGGLFIFVIPTQFWEKNRHIFFATYLLFFWHPFLFLAWV